MFNVLYPFRRWYLFPIFPNKNYFHSLRITSIWANADFAMTITLRNSGCPKLFLVDILIAYFVSLRHVSNLIILMLVDKLQGFKCGECGFVIQDPNLIKSLPNNYALLECIKESRNLNFNQFSPYRSTNTRSSRSNSPIQ